MAATYTTFDKSSEKSKSVHETFEENHKNPNIGNNTCVQKAKEDLDIACLEEQEKHVKENVGIMEDSHQNPKSRLACNTINESSKRKSSKEERIRAKCL